MNGEHLGTLKQGYMLIPDYEWRFPCSKLDSEEQKALRKTQLTDFIQKGRDEPEKQKRQQKIQRLVSEQNAYKSQYMSQGYQTQQPGTAFGLHKQAA